VDPFAPVVPVARSLFLCDRYLGHPDGRIDLTGIFSALRPAIYPHVRPRLVVFSQLSGGLGDVPFFLEIRRSRDDELIRTTAARTIRFADRVSPINLAVILEGVAFEEPGVYVVSLFCHNTWVCDTVVRLQ
jgi:hypothetical protein